LDFLKKYLQHPERSELLSEGIPENVKNLLLVMQTGGVFHTPDGYTRLWVVTWEKIDSFIPTLRAELFRSVSVGQTKMAQQSEPPQEDTVRMQPPACSVPMEVPIQTSLDSPRQHPVEQPGSSPMPEITECGSAASPIPTPPTAISPVSSPGNFTIQIDDLDME
jgi:brefeldin A-resistance guanine nucleotide exchange factor 1